MHPCSLNFMDNKKGGVGTKFRRHVAAAQSVWFACGLKVTEFVCLKKKEEMRPQGGHMTRGLIKD
jgi:hypothetical protein